MMPEDSAELRALYRGFAENHMNPLWTQTGDLMPMHPKPRAVPHVWKWSVLLPLAEASGRLVPVGRGGERRAIGLANPGLGGKAYVSPTLWAAVQYLGPRETAPEHRHSQNAFRFVVEGEGVWTVVNGDPVRMSRGDLLLTPGWNFHGHHNDRDAPMAWIDGLDIPFSQQMDVGFFEFGADKVTDYATPNFSRGERLWANPGLRPLSQLQDTVSSPLAAFRWEHTDRALTEQLLLEDEGHLATVAPGHAAVRYVNPTTGGDVMPTIRCEFHRLREGTQTEARREVGSTVFQVFEGRGAVVLDGTRHAVDKGDIFVAPSWCQWSLEAETQFDLFRFSDAPIMERLQFMRSQVGG
ncbi:cupin domain-containing protein [Ponticoccus litoralis]|uniref:Cupin domain-containing protein n=2 Tax=Ponticoccus litoralis TaxID=422297 RepID=A0AAW9SQV7_9RHOB